jgi:hypothetical protein
LHAYLKYFNRFVVTTASQQRVPTIGDVSFSGGCLQELLLLRCRLSIEFPKPIQRGAISLELAAMKNVIVIRKDEAFD